MTVPQKVELHPRFARPEAAPFGPPAAATAIAAIETLTSLIRDAIMTNETLWDENERLQSGVDRQMGIVAELRGELGTKRRDVLLECAKLVEGVRDDQSVGSKAWLLAEAIRDLMLAKAAGDE